MKQNIHQPVLVKETMAYLVTDPQGVYVDCTAGGGGHIQALLSATEGQARIIGLDKDGLVLAETREKLAESSVELYHADFSQLSETLTAAGVQAVDGLLADLGVSSFQLDRRERGFSYHDNGPLDMRMNSQDTLDAQIIVNEYPEAELKKIIYRYGEERFAPSIARAIARSRKKQVIKTTEQLADIIKTALPPQYRYDKHPARRTFQAIRMAVNNELGALETMLPQAVQILKPGGRLIIITFHSLEDRMVKRFMRDEAQSCICPVSSPVCICNHRADLEVLTKKPVFPGEEECMENPRARSAKLRAAMKL